MTVKYAQAWRLFTHFIEHKVGQLYHISESSWTRITRACYVTFIFFNLSRNRKYCLLQSYFFKQLTHAQQFPPLFQESVSNFSRFLLPFLFLLTFDGNNVISDVASCILLPFFSHFLSKYASPYIEFTRCKGSDSAWEAKAFHMRALPKRVCKKNSL